MKGTAWFVYIIVNEKGYYYTGITTDIERRFREHSSSKKGAKFFKTGAPVEVVFKKRFPDRSQASKYECFVKKLSRTQKIELISHKRKYAKKGL
ncbi:MAG: GIY-YIG nuclease family protein [Bacteriovoracia bacterium]